MPERATWLARLPDTVRELEQRRSLRLPISAVAWLREPLGKQLSAETAGLVAPGAPGYRRRLYGSYANRDTRVALEG
jgi:hypothetical protein